MESGLGIDEGMSKGGWNNSVSRLTEISSDEEKERPGGKPKQDAWRVRKTTVSTQVAE